MAQVGRPRALNEIKKREVCALVAAGCGIEGAAHYVGCAPSTVRREALRDPAFHEQLRRSEMSAQLAPLRSMQQFAATDWRAAAWLLERTYPQRFARRNMRYVTPEEIEGLFITLADAIGEEIPDEAVRRRVCTRLVQLADERQREQWAAHAPRRDPQRISPHPPNT
jgi:hypothetical protein